MPRKRLPAREPPAKRVTRKSRAARGSGNSNDGDVPKVYQEMLQEAEVVSNTESIDFERALKRRKLGEKPIHSEQDEFHGHFETSSLFGSPNPGQGESRSSGQQIIYNDSASSDESEVDFEDVELDPDPEKEEPDTDRAEQKPLQLDLTESVRSGPKHLSPRRRPVTKAERSLRLDVHRWHLLCLLLHLQCRNRWCEDETIQAILKPIVPRKTISLLHVDESKPQYQRTHSFNVAIEEICATWKREWSITAPGLRRSFWKADLDVSREVEEADDLMDLDDFREAASTRSGSRDLGAQLFCALLRSVAVDTRLVCSLQVLPFSGTAKGETPEKPRPSYVLAPPQKFEVGASVSDSVDSTNPRWRASEYASTVIPQAASPHRSPKRKIRDSPYPIFWVEVFSPAATSWIPLDALVRNTINKPKTGFEPPASDQLNSMSYVIAFEDDGSAKDVTRRYTQFYNAKTRKTRVESTKGGEQWWKRTMRMFRRSPLLQEDRDMIEDTELARREASEAMPRNVQDFKGHPIYVLERHLRRNEVVHPRREVGKISMGKEGKLESVFRRRDVHVVRSSDQWYRRGRDVKLGEVGLKRAKPKGTKAGSDSEAEDGGDGSMLYAEFQTEVYVPPPVVKGRVPKNAYGNLDVYVPSMLPAGAIHLQHPEAAKAARLVGIHYADAVTGFDFKGRQGTAVINGVVIAAEYREAMVQVVEAIEYERVQAEEERKSTLMLQLWRRFLTALRIRKKVDDDYGDHDDDAVVGNEDEDEDETYTENDKDAGGGFMPETTEKDQLETQLDASEAAIPAVLAPPQQVTYHEIVIVESPHKLPSAQGGEPTSANLPTETDVAVDDAQEAGSFPTEDKGNHMNEEHARDGVFDSEDEEEAGGFLPEAPEETESGGFVIDEGGSAPANESSADQEMTTPRPPPASSPPATTEISAALPAQSGAQAQAPSPSPSSANPPPLLRRESTKDSFLDAIRQDDDADSLLSHDPEDDDADPEWLVDSD